MRDKEQMEKMKDKIQLFCHYSFKEREKEIEQKMISRFYFDVFKLISFYDYLSDILVHQLKRIRELYLSIYNY